MVWNRKLISAASVIIFLVLWELCGRQIDPAFLAPPSEIVRAFYEIGVVQPVLGVALLTTLSELVVGVAIAVPVGIVIGLVAGYSRVVDSILDPFVSAIYATPRIVFIPLIILWFGLGFKAKIVFIVLMAVFPVLINTCTGVKNVEASYIELARAFKAKNWQIMCKIVLPGSIPYIIAGIRLSVGMAIIGVILSEMFTAMTGLGYLLVSYANRFKTAKVFVVIITIAMLSLLINEALKRIERRALWWKTGTSGGI